VVGRGHVVLVGGIAGEGAEALLCRFELLLQLRERLLVVGDGLLVGLLLRRVGAGLVPLLGVAQELLVGAEAELLLLVGLLRLLVGLELLGGLRGLDLLLGVGHPRLLEEGLLLLLRRGRRRLHELFVLPL